MTAKCQDCQDTGSLSKDISGMPDCAHCNVAVERVALENWALRHRINCDVVSLWLIYQKGRDDARKASA